MAEEYLGELRILQRLNEYEFAFEADILRTGPVQGGRWEFAQIEKNYKTFAGRPVLIAYIGNRVGDGHNAAERIDPKTGERYRSFTDATAERIIGMISEDESDLSLTERDGYTWLRVKGRIWTYYAKEAVDEIVRTGRMSVSIEAEVHDFREEDGREVYDNWVGLGVTVLGEGVAPAVPGANIRALADMQEEFESMKLRVASLVNGENKPEPTTKEGVKSTMRLSNKQLRNLQEKFGGDYKVLVAQQYEDGSVIVCLLCKSGGMAKYVMQSLDESVVLDRVESVNAQVHFCAGEGKDDICVDASDVTDCIAEDMKDCKDRCEAAENECKKCKETIEQMKNAENARRLSAAKAKATATLAAFNANREEKVGEKCIEALCAEIANGKYTECTDENGAWTGESAVEEKVLSLCAAAVMEMDKASVKSANNKYIWEKLASGEVDDGSVEALLARKGIK